LLYYSISEAAAMTKVKPHVLRYWESQFRMLRPRKNKAGNRMYRKQDLKLITVIKDLLYEQGFTIQGAKNKLKEEREAIQEQIQLSFDDIDRAALLLEVKRELQGIVRDFRELPERNKG
jgi:DNA-binding transcriptional MerR regulator